MNNTYAGSCRKCWDREIPNYIGQVYINEERKSLYNIKDTVRHSKWKLSQGLTMELGINIWECSECRRSSIINSIFCPHCGTRMDGVVLCGD